MMTDERLNEIRKRHLTGRTAQWLTLMKSRTKDIADLLAEDAVADPVAEPGADGRRRGGCRFFGHRNPHGVGGDWGQRT